MIAIPDGQEIAGSYRVDARLGSGAFGTVYRVHHRFLGRLALKVLPYTTQTELDRLTKEGAAHARLAHPNITRVYDVNVAELSGDRFLYIASEYMSLGNLESYLGSATRLRASEWRTLARDILGALAYAHEQDPPVLHRDITPANILVGGTTSRPVFKLGDFGVSAELQDGRKVANAAGTLLFLAPECGFGSYLVESDVYSAAVVLYKALTGTHPFAVTQSGDDPAQYRAKRKPLPPSSFLLGCGRDLDAAMLRGLAPNPFDRFGSASAFREAVLGAVPEPECSP